MLVLLIRPKSVEPIVEFGRTKFGVLKSWKNSARNSRFAVSLN
jgi:hypothetical protein